MRFAANDFVFPIHPKIASNNQIIEYEEIYVFWMCVFRYYHDVDTVEYNIPARYINSAKTVALEKVRQYISAWLADPSTINKAVCAAFFQ
jgi:hypothetical protein